jgi:hypothetical protein
VTAVIRNLVFLLFLPFLAKKFVPIPDLAIPDFFKADLLTFCENSGTVGRPTVPDLARVPDFFSCFVQIFYAFPY